MNKKNAINEILKFKKLSEKAIVPKRGSPSAAGYDLHSAAEISVPKKGKILVPTNLSCAIPSGSYGRIAPRSGLASKNFIDVGAGVIDSDYRGEIFVLLFNFSENDFKISEGDRIAQMIIELVVPTEAIEVKELDETTRGEGGFGSTGVETKLDKSINEELESKEKDGKEFNNLLGQKRVRE